MAVNRAMLRDQIKDVLLQRILDGEYSPGQRIVETRVAEEFGVSQAPVREALRELEILRLVVSEPFRGARVRDVSPQEIAQARPELGNTSGSKTYAAMWTRTQRAQSGAL